MGELESPTFAPAPPKESPSGTARQGKRIENLVDYQEDLFELTNTKFQPNEPLTDPKHRPVRHVRVWEHRSDTSDSLLSPNLNHLVARLSDTERVTTERLNTYREFMIEDKASKARLARVQRGCPLFRVLQDEPRVHRPVEASRRFSAINDVLGRMPAHAGGIPPARKIEFVHPVSARPPDRVDLVSKISVADAQRMKLDRAIQESQRLDLQYHNELVSA